MGKLVSVELSFVIDTASTCTQNSVTTAGFIRISRVDSLATQRCSGTLGIARWIGLCPTKCIFYLARLSISGRAGHAKSSQRALDRGSVEVFIDRPNVYRSEEHTSELQSR